MVVGVAEGVAVAGTETVLLAREVVAAAVAVEQMED